MKLIIVKSTLQPVNGTDDDEKKGSPSRSKESPARSPPEIENMTVVDEVRQRFPADQFHFYCYKLLRIFLGC